MAAKNKQLAQVSQRGLSVALKQSNELFLSKAIAKLNVGSVNKKLRTMASLEEEIEAERRRYAWWKELFDNPESQKNLLAGIEQKGKALQLKMEQLQPHCYTIRQLEAIDTTNLEEEIQLLLVWINENINTDKGMTASQYLTCTGLIISQFGSLTVEHLAICFNEMVSGKEGEQFYGRVDTVIVLSSLNRFATRLAQDNIIEYENAHFQNKAV